MSGVGLADETLLADLSDQISECIDRQFEDDASPAIFAPIDLAAECPQLAVKIAERPDVIATLPIDQDSGNLAQLADVRYFIAQIRRSNPSLAKLDFSGLPRILADALQNKVQDRTSSWWEQLIDWLFRRDPADNDEQDLRWLENILKHFTLSASTARVVLYTGSLLIVVLALVLVGRELRFSKAMGRPLFRRTNTANTREENFSGLADTASINVDKLPENPPALLAICIDYLISKQRLPERRSQTNRQFLHHLQAHNDVSVASFKILFQQAERVLYGGHCAEKAVIEDCLGEVKRLLSQAPDRPPQAATTTPGSVS